LIQFALPYSMLILFVRGSNQLQLCPEVEACLSSSSFIPIQETM
jgi:hypothetical protein